MLANNPNMIVITYLDITLHNKETSQLLLKPQETKQLVNILKSK